MDLHKILPAELKLSDKEASLIADIFMNLALAIENHYYTQIVRYNKKTEEKYPHLKDEYPF
jgi:hypothetical protein